MYEQSEEFQDHLLHWYAENKRDLPWRKTVNPYYIWVSEVMLQQTQVDTVIPYFERFITRFPTMLDLAHAPEEEILKSWEGLGYYSRVRNLQSGVREVVEKYGSRVPNEKDTLLSVKGIGPYTAGAILSIAYKQPEPAVDGNVMRVLSRVFMIDDDIAKQKTRRHFEGILNELIPEKQASSFNQGLMEIGALICKPKNPSCDICPLVSHCRAYDGGVQTQYPVKKKKIAQKHQYYTVLVLRDKQNRYLIHKRSEKGLLASLWEFPMITMDEKETNVLETVGNYIQDSLGVTASLKEVKQQVLHTFSHLKWHLNIVTGEVESLPEQSPLGRCVTKSELQRYPVPVPHQKVMSILDMAFDKPDA